MSVEVSVIIPTKDRFDLLQGAVRSIPGDLRYEVIVVDTGSGSSADWIESLGHSALRMPGATFAEANNEAALKALGSYLLLMNDDVVLNLGTLRRMNELARVSRCIVGAKLLYPNGLVQHAGVGFDIDGNPYNLWNYAPGTHPKVQVSRRVTAVTFACVLIPRYVWSLNSGLDTQFKNGYEDLDFCLRAKTQGIDILYDPQSTATHYTSQTQGRFDHEKENKELFLGRWVRSGELYCIAGIWPFSVGSN